MIYVIATLSIKPGTAASVFEAASPCIKATRQEAGCISYDLTQSMDDANTLIFVERWESYENLKSHFNQPHMLVWREKGAEFILDRKIEVITPENVKQL